jgi:hypothetical protein
MRTRVKVAVLGLAVAGLMAAGLVAPAGAGKQIGTTIDIEKVVVGTPPPGATYTVNVNCDDGQSDQVTFTGPGTEVVTVLLSDPGMICTVTEPGTGGASSVSFACADQVGATECQSDSSIQLLESGDALITITNTFDPSTPVAPGTPATPVPGTPRFTG